jgi:hypothetical protein
VSPVKYEMGLYIPEDTILHLFLKFAQSFFCVSRAWAELILATGRRSSASRMLQMAVLRFGLNSAVAVNSRMDAFKA